METKMTDDAALAAMAASGDEKAFSEIVSRHKAAVYSAAARITGSTADADEVAQDVFVKVYFSLPKFEARSSLATWIYRIAVNASLDRLRKNARRAVERSGGSLSEDATNRASYAAAPAVSGASDIRRLLGSLEEKYRAPIALREYEGLKYDEISRTLGISVGQVKIRIFRARSALKKKIADERAAVGEAYALNAKVKL